MRSTFVLAAFLLLFVPVMADAQDAPVTRRDGFLLLWQGIRRPALPAWTAFDDLPETERGSLEIDYAVDRGIIDEAQSFYPDDPLTMRDAIFWLLRTRNVDFADEMNEEHLAGLLEQYPIADINADLSATISQNQLIDLARTLDTMLIEEDHEVSLYSEKFHGKGTAFGETFDMYAMTAAHPYFPHNTLVKVTNIENNQSIVVRINDRGPFVEGRHMDLSLGSFTKIAERSKGKIRARFQRLGDASLVDVCNPSGDRFQKRITRDVVFENGVPHTFTLGGTLQLKANAFFVVRGITYPDGTTTRLQDWVGADEEFSFTPSVEGRYQFIFGTAVGRRRLMQMAVSACDDPSNAGPGDAAESQP